MRRSTLIAVAAVALVAVGAWFALKSPFNQDRSLVERMSKSFMEDLKFKDFRGASLYSHLLDRARLDIGKTLEALFQVKPEFFDLQDFDVVRTELDSSGQRASVHMRARYKILNKDKELRENNLILYWIRRHPDCPLGATCPAGQCLNERGEAMLQPAPLTEEEKARRANLRRDQRDDKHLAADDPYTCDASKKPEWFMNLDSTLKEKPYEDAQPAAKP
jgi:hypothetical protein